MAKASNPLLIALRNIAVPCMRKYTTNYKHGAHRVKYYNVSAKSGHIIAISNALTENGWENVYVAVRQHKGVISLLVTAFPPSKG